MPNGSKLVGLENGRLFLKITDIPNIVPLNERGGGGGLFLAPVKDHYVYTWSSI